MRTLAKSECYMESRCACLRGFRHACCASGLVVHLSHTASANDLARLECELWKTQNGMWNADVLVYDALGMRFVPAGLVVHVSGRCGASDLAGIECELGLRQNGIFNLYVLFYYAAGMCLRSFSHVFWELGNKSQR